MTEQQKHVQVLVMHLNRAKRELEKATEQAFLAGDSRACDKLREYKRAVQRELHLAQHKEKDFFHG